MLQNLNSRNKKPCIPRSVAVEKCITEKFHWFLLSKETVSTDLQGSVLRPAVQVQGLQNLLLERFTIY